MSQDQANSGIDASMTVINSSHILPIESSTLAVVVAGVINRFVAVPVTAWALVAAA
ncbi:hypothetical protein D3C77_817990 [compost metagenome]